MASLVSRIILFYHGRVLCAGAMGTISAPMSSYDDTFVWLYVNGLTSCLRGSVSWSDMEQDVCGQAFISTCTVDLARNADGYQKPFARWSARDKLMGLESVIALFIGVAALATKPGPGMVTVASKAISEGILSVFFFMIGTNLVKILFFALVVFGFTFVKNDLLILSGFIKAVAANYLIWLGVKGLQKFKMDMPDKLGEVSPTGFKDNFMTGFIMTLSNPLDILFFAGVLPAILDITQISFSDFIIAAIVIIMADSIVALSYAVPLSLTRKLFTFSLMEKVNNWTSLAIISVELYIGYSTLPMKNSLSLF